jgi:hypothetical protein
MAQLSPDGDWLIQQADSTVHLFHRYTGETLVTFDPADRDAVAKAVGTINQQCPQLTDEQKAFAAFWCGYFYAHAHGAPTLEPTYTADQINTTVNAAVDMTGELFDTEGDENTTDMLNFVVNAAASLLTNPDVSTEEVIADNYDDEMGADLLELLS